MTTPTQSTRPVPYTQALLAIVLTAIFIGIIIGTVWLMQDIVGLARLALGGAMMTQAQLNELRNLYKQFREQAPSSPVWYQVIDVCVDVLMQNYIAELEDRMPMVGLDDD